MPRYQSGSVQFKTTDLNGGSALDIGGITQIAVATGTETLTDESGDIYDETISIVKQAPSAIFRTKSITSALAAVGLGGYCILSDGSHPGLRLFCKALGDCKSPPLSTDGAQYTIGTGLVVLGSLTARRGQDAEISLNAYALTDGTNAPLAGIYSSITFPTISTVLRQQFTLGVCKIASFTLADLDELQINFGCQMTRATPAMGSVWLDSIAVRKVQPVITFRSYDPTILADAKIALAGVQASHANTTIQLKKRLNYSTFVADATTSHIKITANGLAVCPEAFSGSGSAEGMASLSLRCIHDGTNVPIIFNTASAYTSSP